MASIRVADRLYDDIAWDRSTSLPVTFPVAGMSIDPKSRADARRARNSKANVKPNGGGGANGGGRSRGDGRGQGGRDGRGGGRHQGYESCDSPSDINTDMHILNNITTRHNTHINLHTIPICLLDQEGKSITRRVRCKEII